MVLPGGSAPHAGPGNHRVVERSGPLLKRPWELCRKKKVGAILKCYPEDDQRAGTTGLQGHSIVFCPGSRAELPKMADDFFQVSQVGSASVVSLTLPETTDSNEFDRLNEDILVVFADRPGGNWVLDVTGLDYMGSSALGLLVNIRQRVIQSGGQLVLCGLSPQLLRVFRTCCMERLFRISKTRAEAVKSIAL